MSESGVLMMIPERKMLNEGEGVKLELTRVIKANRERVFAAWTKPEMIMKWFGPIHKVVSDVTVDLRVGGAYRIEMTGPSVLEENKGEIVTAVVSGVYVEIVPNELLRFTWHGTWRPEEETLVTVALKDVANGTELTVIHERLSDEQASGARIGWTTGLDKMVKYFEEQA